MRFLPLRHDLVCRRLALVNAVGNLGGYFGPTAIGLLKGTGGHAAGLGFVAAVLLVAAVLALKLPALPAGPRDPEHCQAG
ncbi:hypothetical protein [Sphingomonas sp. MS122]|uniref:hypothetical protein n=1 Tax=Sphingomonas sp. MS122 TaxID=3412683 RepID=UPI003C2D3198